MAPKTTESTGARVDVSWQSVKAVCSAVDMERLACLGLLSLQAGQVNKQTYIDMAREISGTVKPESHRRVMDNMIKRIKESAGTTTTTTTTAATTTEGETNGEVGKGKKSKAGVKKRKVADEVEDGSEESEEAVVEQKPKAKKGKKNAATPELKEEEEEEEEEGEQGFH